MAQRTLSKPLTIARAHPYLQAMPPKLQIAKARRLPSSAISTKDSSATALGPPSPELTCTTPHMNTTLKRATLLRPPLAFSSNCAKCGLRRRPRGAARG
ncbi:hypothetical protein CFE70_010689 [Pyrenophora teres f. teres 0-1]